MPADYTEMKLKIQKEEKQQQKPQDDYTNIRPVSQKVLVFSPASGGSLFLRHHC